MTLRRVLTYTGLLTLALLIGVYIALKRSDFARSLIIDALAGLFSARLQLEDAELDPLGGTVRIENLRLTPGAKDGQQRRDTLRIPEIVVGVSMNPLGRPGQVRTLSIERPELDLYLGDPMPFDIATLLKLDGKNQSGGTIPSVDVKDMTVRLHFPSDNDLQIRLSPIQLSVRPEKGNPNHLIVRGTCPNPLGGKVRIHGTADIEKKQFKLLAEAEQFELRTDDVQALGSDVAQFAKALRLQGMIQPTLWLEYPKNGQLDGGVRAEFRKFQVLPPTFRYLLTHLDGSAAFSLEDNGTLDVQVDRCGTDLELEGAFRLTNLGGSDEFELTASARNVLIDGKLEDALRGIPAAARVWDALNPRGGRGDLDIHVHEGMRTKIDAEGEVPWLQLDLTLRDTRILFEGLRKEGKRTIGFPYPITLKSARVGIRDDFIMIHEFTANGEAGGTLEGLGEIDAASDEIDIKVSGKDMPFCKELEDALARAVPDGGQIYDMFAPRGELDFRFHLFRREDMESESYDAKIFPRGASATWKNFALRVDNLVGDVSIRPDEISFRLRGNRPSNAVIRARGLFRNTAAPDQADSEVWIQAENAKLDDALRSALGSLDPDLKSKWDLFAPRGTFDLDFLGWTPPGSEQLSFDLRADLKGVRSTFQPFPVTVREIRGPLVLHGDGDSMRLEALGVTGRGLDARLLFRGSMEFRAGDDRDPVTDLSVVAKGIRLNEELADILVERGFVTRELWKLAQATGTADAVLAIKRNPFGDPKTDRSASDWERSLTIDLRQVTSRAAILPDTLTKMSGEVRIDPDQVIHLTNIHGMIGESRVSCDRGEVRQVDGDTLMYLELGADQYPVDDRLANLLDGAVKRAYLERNARGRVSVVGFKMTLRVPREPPEGIDGIGLAATFHSGEFRAHNLALDLGIRVSDINGSARLTKGFFDHLGGRVEGDLRGLTLRSLGQLFSDARGPFVATHKRFTLPTGQVQFHGGWIRSLQPQTDASRGQVDEPLVQFEFDDRRHLAVNLDIKDIYLERLIRGFQTLQNYKGRLSGQVRLALDTVDPTSLELKASFGIAKPGYLGDVPIFRSIYKMLRPDKRPNFDSGLLVLQSKGGRLEIERLMVSSPVMKVEGKGWVGYDGYLQLEIDFPDLFPEASPITILPGVYRFLANSLVSYDVAGYIGNLRTGARFVPFESRPKRVELAPLPGRAAKTSRIFQ